MNYTFILLLLTATMASTQKLQPSAVAAIMQEILSPTNIQQAIQLKRGILKTGIPKMVIDRRNIIQESNQPKAVEFVSPAKNTALPRPVPKKVVFKRPLESVRTYQAPAKMVERNPSEELPPRTVIVKQSELAMPKKVMMQKPKSTIPKTVVLMKDFAVPTKIEGQKPKTIPPKAVYIKNYEPTSKPNRKILAQKASEIPLLKNFVLRAKEDLSKATTGNKTPAKVVVVEKNMPRKEYAQIKPVSEIKVTKVLKKQPQSEQVTQIKAVPVLSVMNRPIKLNSPQSKGQYLRKTPIPPPTA